MLEWAETLKRNPGTDGNNGKDPCVYFLNGKAAGEMPFRRRDVQMCERSIRSPQPSRRPATLLVSGNEGTVAAVTDQGGWLADMPGEAGAHGKSLLLLGAGIVCRARKV